MKNYFNGEAAVLEMQTSKSADDLKRRAEYYTCILTGNQKARGVSYGKIKRVYQIFFLDCILFPQSEKLIRHYYYQEAEEHDRLSNLTEIIFYELPKFEKRILEVLSGNTEKETLTVEEKWCIYMKYRHEKQAVALIKQLCRKLKARGRPLEEIAEDTGLSIEEIEKL